MCRISGFWEFNNTPSEKSINIITAMSQCLEHGGPDDDGVFLDSQTPLALGHRRLSIIDTSKNAHQPMQHPSGRWVICYNGEIYNFKDIKAELEAHGDQFKSTSDTEVILHAWDRWGDQCLSKFRGMFAIAIWDTQEKQLTLVRDRVGVKPLYWYYHAGVFMFASEIKALHHHPKFQKKVSMDALSLYFKHGYIRAPLSIFENTFKLEPGHILTIDQNQAINQHMYWDVNTIANSPNNHDSHTERVDQLNALLTDCIGLRMVSDVPVGVFLSGGIDSSLVTAIMQAQSERPVQSFTIGFEDQAFNEASDAKAIANYWGTTHHEHICTAEDCLSVIPKLADIYDEPFADQSAVPTYLVSDMTKSHVKVALSADGGDELFARYNHYRMWDQISRLKQVPGLKASIKWGNQLGLFNGLGRIHPRLSRVAHRAKKLAQCLHTPTSLNQIEALAQSMQSGDELLLGLNQGIASSRDNVINGDGINPSIWDMLHYLPDNILVKVDRAGMSVALEGREPLLDHHLIEWSMNIPYHEKHANTYKKQLLRDVLYRYIPKELVDRPKSGFSMPLERWLKGPLKDQVFEQVNSNGAIASLVDGHGVEAIRDRFYEGQGHPQQVWQLLMVQLWAERWL